MPKYFVMFFIFSCFFLIRDGYTQDSFDLGEFTEGLSVEDQDVQKQNSEPKEESSTSSNAQSGKDDGEYEKIAVTGSHIKRIDMEGASPVFTVNREMIEQSGHNSVSDVLRDMTASSFGGLREESGSSAAGVSSVSLRGLGADKTLVLLNGKRLPQDAVTGSVDLNLIPLAAVKRIDILKDGASATYGSDALGGVVNIITHRDFNGSELSYRDGRTTRFAGGNTKQVDLITGSATSNSFITTVLSYRENGEIFSRDRPWSNDGISTIGSPGSYLDSSGTWKADTNNCDPNNILDGGSGNEFCSFKYSDFSTELPELRQLNLMSLYEYEINSDLTLFGRVNATKKQINWQYAPAPGQFSIAAAQAATLGIPGYAGGDVKVRYRAVELGNRVTEVDTYSIGFQTGVKGILGDSWDWDLTFDRNTVYKNDLGVSGYGLKNEMISLIESGKFNPFDYSSNRGTLESAEYQPWQLSRSENNFTELRFSGELFSTAHGAAGGAIGVTHTQEKFSSKVDDLSERGDVFGSAGSSGGGSRETKSAFIETITPLAKGMELQIAARYDEFSDFGSTTNPKLGFKWNITNKLLLRLSAGTGFKAPQLKDLYAAASDGFPTFIDQVACQKEKEAGGSTPSCDPQQWNVRSGGNESLQEEESESYNMGLLYQVSKRSSMGFDVWLTKLDNVIGINYEQLTEFEKNGGNFRKYGIEIERDSSGAIDYIDAPLLNLAALEISGVDFNFDFAVTNNFRFQMQHSHLFYYKNEGFPGTGYEDILGENGFPAWRNNITLSYNVKQTSLRLIAKTISEHDKAVPEEGELPNYTELDFNISQQFGDNTTASIIVQNMLGTIPPLDDSNQNQQLNTSLYNPRGQSVIVGLNQKF